MRKLYVSLTIVKGGFDRVFHVLLQIGKSGKLPFSQTLGELPPAPQLYEIYSEWRRAYRYPTARVLKPIEEPGIDVLFSALSAQLQTYFNQWLNCEQFRPIKEALLTCLSPRDSVRVLIQSTDLHIWQLPWHLWDVFARYPLAEVALSTPIFNQVALPHPPRTGLRVLGILGNDTHIDVNKDRAILEQLPDVQVTFLVKPRREEIHNWLWEHPCDLLFFAGHSGTENGSGMFHINQTDRLSISDLRGTLQQAIGRGLQIAIFNSCEGLGLGRDLASLQIPQMIVMREPVPDLVAQEFLKYFLQAYSGGTSFYLSVKNARSRLQCLEYRFPCASWLPAIVQNPAFEAPTWRNLTGVKAS